MNHPQTSTPTLSALRELASDLWWTWDPESVALFQELAPHRWDHVNHNATALLQELTPGEVAGIEARPDLAARIQAALDRREAVLSGPTWAQQQLPELGRVVYLSMEFGLHQSLRIYSGGLGVLAGDHLRSAADLGLDFTGIGLFYRGGYFRQLVDDGRQAAAYPQSRTDRLPMELVRDAEGAPLRVSVPDGTRHYSVQLWRLRVGHAQLLLLDSDLQENPQELRDICASLYGGDTTRRIRQEVLLGVGGMRALRALGHTPDVLHLNEGHCAFAPVEWIRQKTQAGTPWRDAVRSVQQRTVFTTHTPVPAGHDRFGWDLVNPILGPWRDRAGWPKGTLMDLGRVRPHDLDEALCMTVLALRLSRAANGVSALHGEVSRDMWAELELPIGHVTNGVHPTFWMGTPMQALLDARAPGWRDAWRDVDFWTDAVAAIPDADLWAARQTLKDALRAEISERTGVAVPGDHLLIGFARRFAPYKRANLIFRDPERLTRLLDRGVVLVFAGKAHPRDTAGQDLVADVLRHARDPRFMGRVLFLEGYEMHLGHRMTAGADVWLNNPRRPREASGTSGQKVVLNGGLNCSVLDGWWPEGYDGTNGFAIGDDRDVVDLEQGDARDAEALYTVLEQEVLPLWEARDAQGLPSDWLTAVRRSLCTGVPVFNTHRMVADYAERLYATS
jgi:starch phosphorylase